MSKIFEALQGTRNETSDLLPALVNGESNEVLTRTLVPGQPQELRAPPPESRAMPLEPPAAPRESPAEPAPAPSKPVAAVAIPQLIRRMKLTVPPFLPVLPFGDQHKAAAEQYRIVRTKIIHHPKRPRTIGVTSPSQGDGKSITAINIAGALSLKAAAKILLVDVDFRRSSTHTMLGLPKSPGLANVIEGKCQLEEAIIEIEDYPNLNVMSAGDSSVNPSELLESPRWHSICEVLRATYEFVILDTPPVGVVADWDLIQMVADGVVLVVCPDHTKRSSCTKVLDSIPREKLIGVVLNQTKPWPFGRFIGRYEYGYGGDAYGHNPPKAGEPPQGRTVRAGGGR